MSKTVLIVGAGVSRAAGGKRAVANRPPLDSDFFEIARLGRHSSFKDVVELIENFVGDYSSVLHQSLERAATYLYLKAVDSKSGEPYHLGFLNFLSLLTSVLARTTNSVKISRRSLLYRFILSELNRLENPSDLTIITFNYDLLIEKTLDTIANYNGSQVFQFPDCYRLDKIESITPIQNQPQFNNGGTGEQGISVLKLHGSMNWLSRHTSNIPKPSALFASNREIHIADSPEIETGLRWKRNRRTIYMKPIIVPPVSGKKGMMHKSFENLWSEAALSLREADRIVVSGYSCPPLDIEARILLSENLRQNISKKLYVIDPDAEAAAKFVELCGVSHTTIYSSIKAWVEDAE